VGALLLSLAAAVSWGTADFLGGVASRRAPVLAVLACAQAAGLITMVVLVLATGARIGIDGALWAMGSGMCGALAIGLFYAGLSSGAMSLVAPLSALGAIVPVSVAVAGGEQPPALAVVGMVLALGGAVLVSRAPGVAGGLVLSRRVLLLALGAGLGFGATLTLLQQGSGAADSSDLGVVLVQRITSWSTVILALAVTRTSPRVSAVSARIAVLAGLGDTGANALFVAASGGGQDALVAVLGGLYPVTTVVLARVALHERMSAAQGAGVLTALLGIVLVTAA
jgi:drug/metabolite transporter (DMT)-like permease